MESSPARQRLTVLPMLVTLVIAFYIAMDSVFLRAFPGQRAVYASIALVAGAILVLRFFQVRLLSKELALVTGWVLINAVWLLLALTQERLYPVWMVGDFVSLLLPLLLYLVAARYPELFTDRRLVTLFALFLLAGALLGALVGLGPNNRFESPATALFPLAWLAFAVTRGGPRYASGACVLVLGVLAFGAGERTAAVIWLLSGLAVYGLLWPVRRVVLAVVAVAIVVAAFGSFLFQAGIRDALEQTRFRQNLEGQVDASLVTRINEYTDVMHHFREAPPAQKLLGHGHGAAFRPVFSLTMQNLSADGYLHHVHIGPALVLYRYGIAGVAVLLWLWWKVFAALLRHRARPPDRWNLLETAFTLSLLMYLVDFLLRNVMADPAFSYVAAGFLFLQSRRKADA